MTSILTELQDTVSCSIMAVDVHYAEDRAVAAGVLLSSWTEEDIVDEVLESLPAAVDYRPGKFYLRELECIQAVINSLMDLPNVVIVDGYVWLDAEGRKGLGARLHDCYDGAFSVIGVAKNYFRGSSGEEVCRGNSKRPLHVTAVGMTNELAADHIRRMQEPHRIPQLLQHVDHLCRGLRQPT